MAIDLAKVNSKAIVKEFKKSLKLQEYLNFYRISLFNMTCEDTRRHLQAKKLFMDTFFIDIVHNAF